MDVALGCDPRIKRIKQEEKDAREAKKKGKTGANGLSAKQKLEEEKKKALEEAKKKEEEEKVCYPSPVTQLVFMTFSNRLPRPKRRKRKQLPQMLPKKQDDSNVLQKQTQMALHRYCCGTLARRSLTPHCYVTSCVDCLVKSHSSTLLGRVMITSFETFFVRFIFRCVQPPLKSFDSCL